MLTSYSLNIYEVRTTITDAMHFWSRAIHDILMRTLLHVSFSAAVSIIRIDTDLSFIASSPRTNEWLIWCCRILEVGIFRYMHT